MMQGKNIGWKCCALILVGVFLGGAQEQCDGGCPTGSIDGPNRSCLYEIVANGKWFPVNSGELKVQIPAQTQARKGRFAFWFVEDPVERSSGLLKGRVGRWKLLIRNYEPGEVPQQLILSWRLRDTPQGLSHDETIRLAVVDASKPAKKRQLLPGSYDPKGGRVRAKLFEKPLPYDGLILVPVRYSRMIGRGHRKESKKTIEKI